MRTFRPRILLALLLSLTLGGCSGFVFFSNGQVLVAVTINPTFADPINFPNLEVQFSASGSMNGSLTPVNLVENLVWTVDHSPFNTPPELPHAFITQNGLARCAPGFAGLVHIFATAPANPSLALSPSNQKVGMAQMNCP
jgi:hypothetical protein